MPNTLTNRSYPTDELNDQIDDEDGDENGEATRAAEQLLASKIVFEQDKS